MKIINNQPNQVILRTIAGDIIARVAFKSFALFIKRITKINGTTIDDAKDLDLVMPIYNLLEYSSYYSDMTDSFWFCSKDEATTFDANIADNSNFKTF